MLTIYKHEIRPSSHFKVNMPFSAEILKVEMQHTTLCMWTLVDSDNAPAPRNFSIYSTGVALPTDLTSDQYIGTFQMNEGDNIFHLFDEGYETDEIGPDDDEPAF